MIAFKNSIYHLILMSVIAVILPLNLSAQEEKPLRVLFVGNSFTYFWNMPQLVQAMGASQGVSLEIRQSTVGGSNLKQHWLEEKGTLTRKFLKEERWDYVILGDHSLSTINTPESFDLYAKKFTELVRSIGAEPLFYMTWAYKSNPLMQPFITKGYQDIATELDASVIPVGPIWMRAKELRPDLNLYFDDKHPSPDGSYLIALIVYHTLTGNSINQISNRVTTIDSDGEKLYLSFILKENAVFFQQLVTEAEIQPIKLEKE